MSTQRRDVPGDAHASTLAVQRHLIATGERVALFERFADNLFEDGITITGITMRAPNYESAEYLFIVRATKSGAKVVAFHAGETFEDGLRGTLARMGNKSLKWREDSYD